MRKCLRQLCLFVATGLVLGLAGCAQPKKVWTKPGMTQDQWAVDSATCRSRARHLAEDAMAAEPPEREGGVNSTAGYSALMRKHSAGKSMESLYRRCLERLGYRLVDPKPKTGAKA